MSTSFGTQRYLDFIAAWFECATMAEVCQRTGLDRRAASNVAAQIRRYGAPLPAKRAPGHRPPNNPNGPVRQIDRDALRTWARICADRAAADRYRRGA